MALIAQELFEYASGQPAQISGTQGLGGGYGWWFYWEVQDQISTVQITSGSLNYSGLGGTGVGNKLSGGSLYRVTGRHIYPSAQQLSTCYVSVSMSRLQNWSNWCCIHDNSFSVAPPSDGIYFGSDGSGNIKIWTDGYLDESTTAYPSDGTVINLVVKIQDTGS